MIFKIPHNLENNNKHKNFQHLKDLLGNIVIFILNVWAPINDNA